MVATLNSKKYKRRYGDACGGVWRSLHLARVRSQAVGFVLVRLAVTMKMFSQFNLLYKDIL
jgi:hypothetical protein